MFALAPFLVALLREQRPSQHILLAALFAAAWRVPGAFWYFWIFPAWLAALMITGNIALLVLVICLPGLAGLRRPIPRLIAIAVLWTALIGLRANMPATAAWVVPNLTHLQWLNPLTIQAARLGDFSLVAAVLIAVNGLWAVLWQTGRRMALLAGAILVLVACIGFDADLRRRTADRGPVATVIGVQAPVRLPSHLAPAGAPETTEDEIQDLMRRTIAAIADSRAGAANPALPLFVVWPENDIPGTMEAPAQALARDQAIYLTYHIRRPHRGALPFAAAVLVGPDGTVLLENNKRHPAPGERITGNETYDHAQVGALTVLTDICYDLHFPDIGDRLQGADLLLAPVDDDRFRMPFPMLHAAEATYRAVENNVAVATASTNGPSFMVQRNGLVSVLPLPLWALATYTVEVMK
ncbi:MAG: nitrilase-related carbon-nitrogen hydrolase [Paracoccaceae bacterium]